MPILFATRPSELARRQTSLVIQWLMQLWPGLECLQEVITTSGDRILDQPLPEIGGKGLFTQELEAALRSGAVQAAVHSLKDLPVADTADLVISAIPRRREMRDVLVSAQGYTLDTLPKNAVLGTSSLRRQAMSLAYRPDLQIVPLRGNVDTRLRKALEKHFHAILLSGVGLLRLGLVEHITQWLPLGIMPPAPGQGALAVQCRQDDDKTRRLLSALDHLPSRLAVTAERAFLEGLGGGCSLPVGAYATVQHGWIHLHGVVASLDGSQVIRLQGEGQDALQLGKNLAQQAVQQGADQILSELGVP